MHTDSEKICVDPKNKRFKFMRRAKIFPAPERNSRTEGDIDERAHPQINQIDTDSLRQKRPNLWKSAKLVDNPFISYSRVFRGPLPVDSSNCSSGAMKRAQHPRSAASSRSVLSLKNGAHPSTSLARRVDRPGFVICRPDRRMLEFWR